ncbi:Maf family protein [Cohnella faecalis]|uniref:Maf family protein n=1 Tax=Cohnella faecalis TaxID=2315694 RepID=UPI003620F593
MKADKHSATTLILASSSPRRRELIATLGLPVRVIPSQADEDTPEDWQPSRVVEELALRKARTVRDALQNEGANDKVEEIVVGSDTIVALDGAILGKPTDEADARRMLGMLSGRVHEVFTGVCCIRVSDGRTSVAHRVTKVRFRSLSADQIERYVRTGEPMDKAGAYGIQEVGALLVDSFEGCYFNVVGLPLSLLADLLEPYGITVP